MTKYNVPAEIFKFLQDNDIQTDGYASVRNYRGKVSLRHDTYLEVLKIVRIDSRLGGKQDCLNRMLLGYSIIVVTGLNVLVIRVFLFELVGMRIVPITVHKGR